MAALLPWVVAPLTLLAALSILVLAALRGWQGWLDLRRYEVGRGSGPSTVERIELADLRERVRNLEAIAACVDP